MRGLEPPSPCSQNKWSTFDPHSEINFSCFRLHGWHNHDLCFAESSVHLVCESQKTPCTTSGIVTSISTKGLLLSWTAVSGEYWSRTNIVEAYCSAYMTLHLHDVIVIADVTCHTINSGDRGSCTTRISKDFGLYWAFSRISFLSYFSLQ